MGDADDQQKERIASKNDLESYCFNMKSTIDDDKFKDKIPESDRKIIMDKCQETISWLDHNQTAEIDEYKDKQNENQGAPNSGMPSGSCGSQSGQGFGNSCGPTVE